MFIKLTEENDGGAKYSRYILIKHISSIATGYDNQGSIVGLLNGVDHDVDETPAEILQLINQAKFSDLLNEEIAKPIKIVKKSSKRKARVK